MSKLVERLAKELSAIRGNSKLIDVKFFLGDDRNIAQEKLVEEAANGFAQIRFGNADEVELVDNNVHKLTVEQFLR